MRRVIAAVLVIGLAGLACAHAADPEQSPAQTTTGESEGAPSAGPGPLVVSVTEATYGCGPADGIEVRFTVTSNQQFQAVASLVVGGRNVATGAPFQVPIGTVVATLPVTLGQETYGMGEGDLQVSPSPDGGGPLAHRSTALRIAGGGCG